MNFKVKKKGGLGKLVDCDHVLTGKQEMAFRGLPWTVEIGRSKYRLLEDKTYTNENNKLRRSVKYERIN